MKFFRKQGLRFPRRLRKGPNKGTVAWGDLGHSRTLQILHNPRYAGAFAFGRSRVKKNPDGHTRALKVPREEWLVLLPEMHEGYLPWAEFEDKQKRLLANSRAHGLDRRCYHFIRLKSYCWRG